MLCKASLLQGTTFHTINPLRFYGMVQIVPIASAPHTQARLLVQSYCLGEITQVTIDSLAFDPPQDDQCFASGVSNCTSKLGIPAYEVLKFVVAKPVYRLMACLSSGSPGSPGSPGSSGPSVLDDSAYIRLELEGGCVATMNLSTQSALHANDFVLRVVGSCGELEWTSQRCNVRGGEGREE